jgi:type I restriction enzyme S subunit
MNKWKFCSLEELGEITSSKRIFQKEYVNKGIPFYRTKEIKELANKKLVSSELFISMERYEEIRKTFGVPKIGDILITAIGTVGEIYIVEDNHKFYFKDGNILWFKSFNKVNPFFLKYLLFFLINDLKNLSSGSAYKALPIAKLKRFQIPLPPIDEQRRIAAILDQADAIRRKRQQAIALTDELLRSTFLEMFGDPVINPKGWEVKKLEEVALKRKGAIKCGPFGSQLLISEFVKDGIPVYGIDNVQKNEFVWAKPKYITTEKYEQLKSFSIQDEDVLISRTGTVGRTCVAPPDIPRSILGPNLLKVSLNTNKMLPKYLSYALNHSNPLIEEIKRMSPGATVAVFNTTNLKALRLTIPHINLQSQFVNFTENVELTKQKESNYLTESNNLFNSLLQRAFKGQL